MTAAIAEILADRAARIGSDVLHRRGIGSGSRDHDAVFHRAVLFESLHHLRNSRALLADGDVDADHVAALLIDDRVQQHRRFYRSGGRR